MIKMSSFALLILGMLVGTNHAMNPSRHRTLAFILQPWSTNKKCSHTTTSRYLLRPLLSSTISNVRKTKEKIEIEQEAERQEEDFLFAQVKPKILNHERDFFRQSTRVQAWDEYVLVSILCTSISFNALQNFRLNPEHEGIFIYESVIKVLVQITAAGSVLSGLYATMVFSLSILYGKTALGLERDPQYDNFLDNTGDIRYKANIAFSLALGFFALLVILVLAEDLPTVMHLPVGGVMIGALYLGYRDWKRLIDNATPIYKDD